MPLANITLGPGTCDGKVWTFPLLTGGVTGSGYAITNANGLTPHTTNGGFGFPIASAAISTTNLVVTSTVSAGIINSVAEGLQFDIATAAGGCTLTDGSGNTPTGQTNVSVTNSSAVTVAIFNPVTNYDKFELNGLVTSSGTLGGLAQTRFILLNGWAAGILDNAPIEWVTDALEVAWVGYSGAPPSFAVDGGSSGAATASTGFWSLYCLTPTALASGRHLFRASGDYFTGVRLVGGTRSMYAVPTTKASLAANTTSAVNVPASTPVKIWGAYSAPATNGAVPTASYVGLVAECQIGGTGLELSTVTGTNSHFAVSVDEGFEGAIVVGGDASNGNLADYAVLAAGLTAGATHTVHATWVSANSNTTHRGVRVTNGTKLASAASIADGTISVAAVTNLIAVNDWVRIDNYANREWRRVDGISGTGPYTLTLNANLSKAHAAGVQVTSYSAPAGTITAWQRADLSAKRVVGPGDSNTHGASEEGFAGTPDANGTYVEWYDPRRSYAFIACQQVGYEFVNLGIQGTDTANQAARAADIATYSRSAFDYCLVREGTNDINGSTITAAAATANVKTQIDGSKASLRAGGKFILLPCLTQQGHTNSQGLNVTTFSAAMAAIAADPSYSSVSVYASGLQNGFNLTDYNATTNPTGDLSGLHYHSTGIARSANNTIPYLLSSGYTVGVAGATLTVTRGGGSTWANALAIGGTADAITHTASAGTLTVTAPGATITGNGTGTVTVKPADGQTSYTIAPSTTSTVTHTNAQNWTDAAASSVTIVSGNSVTLNNGVFYRAALMPSVTLNNGVFLKA